MKKIFLRILTIAACAVIFTGCSLTEPEPILKPGRLKVNLNFSSMGDYKIQESDFLFGQARDFKIFNGEKFADVFQNPEQFLSYSDSVVSFNILNLALKDTSIQVAFGSVPPLEYDSLLFQIAPSNNMRLDGKLFPLTTNYNEIGIENNYSTIIKLKNKFKIDEDKTTTINIEFKIEKIVFRVLDEFVFNAKPDTFYIFSE